MLQADVFRQQAAHFTLLDLELRVWPERARLVALVDFHGNWLDWLDGA